MSVRIDANTVLGIPIATESGQGSPAAERIQAFVDASTVLLFIKGTAARPACGFSATVVDIFNRIGVPFATFDVLSDPEVRAGAKTFSDWPTFPQVYVGGEMVGGCDIVTQLYQDGELETIVREAVQAHGIGSLHAEEEVASPAPTPPVQASSAVAKGEGNANVQALAPRKLALMGVEHFMCVDVDEAANGFSAPHTMHLPLSQIGTRFEELGHDVNLLFLDATGETARHAAEFLVAKGYRHVFLLEGGVAAWKQASH